MKTLGQRGSVLIDDFADERLVSKLGTQWRGVSDQVMGGISKACISHSAIFGRTSLLMTGDVCLENNGGFIQATLNLAASGDTIDASKFAGVRIVARGNGEKYSVHLRTTDSVRPWQSYRAHFTAGPHWKTSDLLFKAFVPHRLDAALDITRLRRIGLVAIGRPFHAELSVSELSLFL